MAPCSDVLSSFTRIELGQHLIYGTEYARMIKRNNSTILYQIDNDHDVGFGHVHFFSEVNNSNIHHEIIAFVNELKCSNYSENAFILSVTPSDNIKVVPVKNILKSCLFIDLPENGGCYVCMFPNKLESD